MALNDTFIGHKFQGTHGYYTPQRLLGEGLTAWVFEGQAVLEGQDPFPVAIKVMKPGLGDEAQRRFRAEAEHLGALRSAKAKSAPIYYENFTTDRPGAPEVLALELMTGQKVEKLLETSGPLTEADGLALGVQLAELLQALHDSMQRTYTDFKFENLWWGADTRELKVTDWNVISAAGDLSRVPSDLLRAGRYLYTVLTGGEVLEQGGMIVTPFMRHSGWDQLSLATQNVLRKALHRNPQRRYQKASELVAALKKVQRFWDQEPRRTWPEIEDILGDHYQRESYEQAYETLNVLRKRLDLGDVSFGRDDISQLERFEQQVKSRLQSEQSSLESGRQLFLAFSFAEAQQVFTQAQEDDPWNLKAWRWREAARVGYATSGFERLVDDVKLALDSLNAGEYGRAEDMLRRLAVATPALDGLLREARARRLQGQAEQWAGEGQSLIDAGQGDTPEADAIFTKAQNAYQDAADALSGVTPADYRQQLLSEMGDLAGVGRSLADERRSAAAQAGQALRQATASYQADDPRQALATLQQGFTAVPGEKRLLEAAVQYGQERFLAGDGALAIDFLLLAIQQDPTSGPLRAWYRAAAGASGASALLGSDQWRQGLNEAAAALQLAAPQEARAALAGVLASALAQALQRPASAPDLASLRQAVEQTDLLAQAAPNWRKLADDVQRRWPELATDWITARLPALDAGELAEQMRIALALTGSQGQQSSLAANLLPLAQARLAQATGWWRTPGAPALVTVARQAAKAGDAGSPEPPWIVEQQTRLATVDLRADIEAGQALAAVQKAEEIVGATPDAVHAALVRGLQEPLRLAMQATPPAGDLVAARQLLTALEGITEVGREPAVSAWRNELAGYREKLEKEERTRREAVQQRVQQRIEGLLMVGDAGSLVQAKDDLDTALTLTPRDTEDYRRLEALKTRLDRMQTGQLSASEQRQHAEAFLQSFAAELGAARSQEQFELLESRLAEATEQARRSNEPSLITRCNDARGQMNQARSQRAQAERLEKQLGSLRAQQKQMAGQLDVPGFVAAHRGLWEKINRVAGDLLQVHPFHSDAVQAQQDFGVFERGQRMTDRLTALRSLQEELGDDLKTLEQAEARFQAAEPAQARAFVAGLAPEWSGQAAGLTKRIEQGERFLHDAEQLTQSQTLDASFDARLRDLPAQGLPDAYWQQSGLPQWLDKSYGQTLAALAGRAKSKPDRAPEALARFVVLDQSRRFVQAARQGRLPTASQPLASGEAKAFVQAALHLRQAGDANLAAGLEQAAAALPLTDQPSQLAEQVRRAAVAAQDQSRGARWGRVGRWVAIAAAGLLLAGLLAALAYWVWPGVAQDSRPKLAQALQTTTAEAALPRVTIITVEVIVPPSVVTATFTPTSAEPTFTPTPDEPTPTPTSAEPTFTPTPTPEPEATITARAARVTANLPGLNAALMLDSNPTQITFTEPDVIDVLGGRDVGAGLSPLSLSVEISDAGDDNRKVDLASIPAGQTIMFQWPEAPISAAGSYGLMVQIPNASGFAQVDYSLSISTTGASDVQPVLLNGREAQLLNQNTPAFRGKWVYLGPFDIDTPGRLRITASPRVGSAGANAAFYRVAIVRLAE